MALNTVLILILFVVIGVLVLYIYQLPPKVVTVVERPVYDYNYVTWNPWSWGAGSLGWPGSYYVNRPRPHYYGSGASGGIGVPRRHYGGDRRHKDRPSRRETTQNDSSS
jgi:hypothetical protein